jgi:hypothetical protein
MDSIPARQRINLNLEQKMKFILNMLGSLLFMFVTFLIIVTIFFGESHDITDGNYLVEDVDKSTWSSLCQNARGLTGGAYVSTTYTFSAVSTRLAQLVYEGKVDPPSTRFKLKAASEYGYLREREYSNLENRVVCEVEIHYLGTYPQLDGRYVDDKSTFFVDEFIVRNGRVLAHSVDNSLIGGLTD